MFYNFFSNIWGKQKKVFSMLPDFWSFDLEVQKPEKGLWKMEVMIMWTS